LLACVKFFVFVYYFACFLLRLVQISGLFSLGSSQSKDQDSSKKGKKSGGSAADESSGIESPQSLKASPQGKAVLSEGGPPEGSPQLPGYTREYDYDEDPNLSPSRSRNAAILAHGFTYEKDPCQSPLALNQPQESNQGGSRKAVGLAFNYAPGEDKKVAETAAEKRKTFDQQVPDPSSLRQAQPLLTAGVDYVESASRKEQAKGNPVGKPVAVPTPGKLDKSQTEKPEKSSAASAVAALLSRGKKNKDKKEKKDKKKDKKKNKKEESEDSSSSSSSEDSMVEYAQGNETIRSTGDTVVVNTPKIFKTTTKQRMVQNAEGIMQNIEEKVEDLTPGGTGAVTVSNVINTVRCFTEIHSEHDICILFYFFIKYFCLLSVYC